MRYGEPMGSDLEDMWAKLVDAAYEALVAGTPVDEIIAMAEVRSAEGEAEVTRLVMALYQRLQERTQESYLRAAWHREARMAIYRRAMAGGRLAEALSTLRDLAKLDGLYDRQPVVASNEDEPVVALGDVPQLSELEYPTH